MTESTLDTARRGDLDVALAHLAAAPRGAATHTSAFAAAALIELLGSKEARARAGSRGALVGDALLSSLASGARLEGDDDELARGLVDVALHAFLSGDATRLGLVRRASSTSRAHPIVAAWDDLAHERTIDVGALIAGAQRSRGVPGLLAEAEALCAIAELHEGRIDAARDRARLGSRMARTDGFLVTEYVAHLALARVRRFDARWYLASRILDSLARVTPPAWSGWIAWELVLVGGAARAASLDASSGGWSAAAIELAAVLDAASHGDRGRLERCRDLAPWPFLAHEAARVRALVDPHASEPPEMGAWIAGEGRRAPHGMDGLVGSASLLGAGLERAGVVVWAEPGRAARRTWVAGLGLLGRDLPASYDLQHERVLAALVALLVTPSMSAPEEELFRRVYGFAFVPDKHGGVLRTLLYRMRQELGARGEIVREGDALRLRLVAPIAIPDPTTATDLRELVLRFLAENGGRASARDVTEALGVPLRTVQDALGQLVGDESCRRERSGRTHEYALEDTTFFAPTITRLGAWRDAVR